MNQADNQYLNLLEDILENGTQKGDRTGTGTISIFGPQMTFDMSEGFPLLTTKKIYWKGVVHELLWFLKGSGDIRYLWDNNVHIWDGDWYREYSNCTDPYSLEDMIEHRYSGDYNDEVFSLGPIYGKQWVDWNGINQVENVINTLKTNPDDRRMIISAWNVGDLDEMALPPCHVLSQFYTSEMTTQERHMLVRSKGLCPKYNFELDLGGNIVPNEMSEEEYYDMHGIPKRKISLKMYQRSCDTFLGVPFNIASYALLLEMVAQCVNMVPDKFIWTAGDTHVYNNHIEQVKEQMTREPKKLPKLLLNSNINDIFAFCYEDVKIEGYDPHPLIKGKLST